MQQVHALAIKYLRLVRDADGLLGSSGRVQRGMGESGE